MINFGDGNVRGIRHYIKLGPLGRAFASPQKVVLLIDEVDKGDIEFPNDLLFELDEMRFYIQETDEWVKAIHRLAVIVTSNSEKELPDAFLRRCVFHYIDFPDQAQMRAIIEVHFPKLSGELLQSACKIFYGLREVSGLRKRPSTSELIVRYWPAGQNCRTRKHPRLHRFHFWAHWSRWRRILIRCLVMPIVQLMPVQPAIDSFADVSDSLSFVTCLEGARHAYRVAYTP